MRSDEILAKARRYLVGGVSAGGRYHPTLKGPLILESADGCTLRDVDGKEWIDYHTAAGATLLGYNHPAIREALEESITMGFFLNNESEYHADLAELIHRMVPSAEKVRLSNSGTEATLGALRLARAYAGRKKILKFEGHFHGMHEFLFYNWHNRLGSMDANGVIDKVWDTAGMVEEMNDLLVVIPYNDIEIFERTIRKNKNELAAVICEPVMYNAGCIEPLPGYLEEIRRITREQGVLLIFDEVLSGFRMHSGCAQGYYGVTPDLTTLGKAVGCGMTLTALVGREEVMNHLGPPGPVVMSGTYTGALMQVMGALAALEVLNGEGFFEDLNGGARYFYDRITELFEMKKLKGVVQGLGARFGLYFGLEEPTHDYRVAAAGYDPRAWSRFVELALEAGLYFHHYGDSLTPMHSGITTAHTREIYDETLNRMESIFAQMAREGA